MNVIDLNEAFATQGLADDDPRVYPNGDVIALGYPLGASGARLVTTAITMCIGVGQGIAVVERV